MEVSALIFRLVLAFLSFSLASDSIKKVSELREGKGWSNAFHNFLIVLIGMVYLFFIGLLLH